MKDEHGQPRNRAFNAGMRSDREINELIGMCKGMVSDGVVNQAEAEFLANWLALNKEAQDVWPANVLYDRVGAMLKDGVFDVDEEGELLSLLAKVSGGNPQQLNAHSLSSGLPLNSPEPKVEIPRRRFCLTGKFVYGTRDHCHKQIVSRGGLVAETISSDVNYLVIGVVGSRDWIHSTFGTKIQKAVEYREKGRPLAIVSEENFVKSLQDI